MVPINSLFEYLVICLFDKSTKYLYFILDKNQITKLTNNQITNNFDKFVAQNFDYVNRREVA